MNVQRTVAIDPVGAHCQHLSPARAIRRARRCPPWRSPLAAGRHDAHRPVEGTNGSAAGACRLAKLHRILSRNTTLFVVRLSRLRLLRGLVLVQRQQCLYMLSASTPEFCYKASPVPQGRRGRAEP